MTTVLADRLAALPNVTLYRGGHDAPRPDASPEDLELCFNEFASYLAGEKHSAVPRCMCPVISAATMRFNDRADDTSRQILIKVDGDPKDSLAYRCLGTRGDGNQTKRAYLASDFAVRIALPIWLDAAERHDGAARVRALPEIVDPATARSARAVVAEIRKELPDYWTWREDLRAKVRAAVKEALKGKPDAATATAAAAATDAGGYWKTYDVYYKAIRAALEDAWGPRWAAARDEANAEFVKLIERMVALGEGERRVEVKAGATA